MEPSSLTEGGRGVGLAVAERAMGVDGTGHEDQQRHVAQLGQRDPVAARPRSGERDEQKDGRPGFDVPNWCGGDGGAASSWVGRLQAQGN